MRLIAFPEGALQAFNDEVLDLDHATFARECAIDIPGEETDALGKIAKEYNAFVMAQAKARHPDLKDRFFNVGFIINPRGKVILKHYKVSPLFPVEHSVCPHDVYDWWVEKYGRTLDAFWPVVDTEIGRLGIMMANEGSYPENARALALNGAEVVYRASYPHPATGNEIFEIQSRARALDNNMYVVAPNMGTYYLFPEETTPIDTFGGRSFIIDYKGRIVGRQDYGAGSTYVGGVIDIEALRDHRARAQWDNWMKDLRTELYQLLYEKPIYPKNLYLKRAPMKHAEYREKVIKRQIRLHARPRDLEEAGAVSLAAGCSPPAVREVRLASGTCGCGCRFGSGWSLLRRRRRPSCGCGSRWRMGGRGGGRRPRCWRRSGSTRIRRSAMRTTSSSCDARCASRVPSTRPTARLARRFVSSRSTITRRSPSAGAAGLNPLVACYGPALLDRAVLDALCRLHGVSFYEAMRTNLPGTDTGRAATGVRGLRLRCVPGQPPERRQSPRAPHGGPRRSDHRRRPDAPRRGSTMDCPRPSKTWWRRTGTRTSS